MFNIEMKHCQPTLIQRILITPFQGITKSTGNLLPMQNRIGKSIPYYNKCQHKNQPFLKSERFRLL